MTTTEEPLIRPRNASVNTVRPMFQLLDDSCPCNSGWWCLALGAAGDGMRVPASEYDRPDRVFL